MSVVYPRMVYAQTEKAVRVVHTPEEHQAALEDGFADQVPEAIWFPWTVPPAPPKPKKRGAK